jgi:hypothetical protein
MPRHAVLHALVPLRVRAARSNRASMPLASSTVCGSAIASTFLFASFDDSATPSADGYRSLMATVVWTSGKLYEGPNQTRASGTCAWWKITWLFFSTRALQDASEVGSQTL